MELFDFLEFRFLDLVDISLVALLLYYIYRLIRGTVAINIFLGIIVIYLIWELTKALNMDVLSNILGKFISVGFFALIVVFQQEIRKFLLLIGSTKFLTNNNLFKNLSFLQNTVQQSQTNVELILNACNKLAASKTGVLLVIKRKNNFDFLKGTGDEMNIELTQPIIESIFYKNSPLHDGAALVEGNLITATRVILPVSNQQNIPNRFGLRHRAAIGITEKTDALALVVSEETGELSFIKNGAFILFNNTEELRSLLESDLS